MDAYAAGALGPLRHAVAVADAYADPDVWREGEKLVIETLSGSG